MLNRDLNVVVVVVVKSIFAKRNIFINDDDRSLRMRDMCIIILFY